MNDQMTGGGTHLAMSNTQRGMSFAPQSLKEAMDFSAILADSSFVPKDFQGKPGNVLVAIQWGMELGLQPMQAMQNIAVINGRPSLWGDAVLAMVLASPVCEDVVEYFEGTPGQDDYTAVCVAKRKGKQDKIGRFSIAQAKKAKLWTKQGPWQDYPERMLQMRARAFALRDQFPDVLKGMPIAEEVMDYTEKDMGPAQVVNKSSYHVGTREPAAISHQQTEQVPQGTQQHLQREPVATQPHQEAAPQDPQASSEPLLPNMLKMVENNLKKRGLDAADLCRFMQVGSLEEIPKAKVNDALDWIKVAADTKAAAE